MPTSSVLTYEEWNEAIGKHCFNSRNAGRVVRFAVDPLVLHRAAAEGTRRYLFSTPEAAVADFHTAVTRCVNESGWRLGRTHAERTPPGLAKLALQVLAVFEIAPDDEGGSSYWAALCETLGREVDRRGVMPHDLDAETHQENWASLAHWANVQNKGKLGSLPIPDPNDCGRRHVRIPLSHGLLRLGDIQDLHRFFSRINLTPGEEVEPEDLLSDLNVYASDAAVFRGAHARRVLQDERLSHAADQIANAAAQWDGQRVDLNRSRGPVVRLWLAVHSGVVEVSGGLTQVDPRGVATDVCGVKLEQILGRGTVRQQRTPVVYHPIDCRLVVAVRSLLYGRYVESRNLRPGDQVVVAQPHSSDSARIQRELALIAVGGRINVYGKDTSGMPEGWMLYRLRIRDGLSNAAIPPCLRGRLKISGARLRVFGGLRVRGDWIEGAGPTVTVRGGDAATMIIDGVEYAVADGRLHPERCPALSSVGMHEAWLPGRHRDRVRFRVVQPRPARFSSLVVDAGWAWNMPHEWPNRLAVSLDFSRGSVRGPVIEGAWPPLAPAVTFKSAESAALKLAIALSRPAAAGGLSAAAALATANEHHTNLLVRQLARAARSPPRG